MPGLDALRGLSAFGVLLLHYRLHFFAAPMYEYLLPFYVGGAYLVDVFFVLSGFLLGRLYRQPHDCRPFLFKRITRLFPLHWTTLIVVAILQQFYVARQGKYFIYRANDVRHFLLNIGLLQNIGLQQTMSFSFNGPSWSISVEWITNLVFLSVLLVPRFRTGLSALLAVAAALGLWAFTGHLIGFGSLWGWFDAAALRGTFGFFAGVCLAELLPVKARFSRAWDLVGILSASGLLFLLAHPQWRRMPGVDFAMVGLLTPALVAACSHGTVLARACQWRPLVWLGDVSFSVYLWHFPIQICLALMVAYGWRVDFGSPWVLVGFVGLTYLVGDSSWRCLEKPAQRVARTSRVGRWCLR